MLDRVLITLQYDKRILKDSKRTINVALNGIKLCRPGVFIGNFEHSQTYLCIFLIIQPSTQVYIQRRLQQINELSLIKVCKKDKRTALF